MQKLIYLDYNATAPLHEAAKAAMLHALELANPSSIHAAGRQARASIEKARAAIARSVGAKPANIIFTSGATEANHLALHGILAQNNNIAQTSPSPPELRRSISEGEREGERLGEGAADISTAISSKSTNVETPSHFVPGTRNRNGAKRILVSAIEHDAVLLNAPHAERIPVLSSGVVDLAALENLLQKNNAPTLVAVMAVNNETGVVQPIAEISAVCKKHNALLHVDAVQALARIPIDIAAWGADSIALSAHKAGGPKGIGCLIARDNLPVTAQIKGGGQEQSRRAGTENVPAIAGFGAVADYVDELLSRQPELQKLQRQLEAKLMQIAGVAIYGQDAPRVANTTLLTLAHAPSATQLMHLDLAGFAVSSGSACSSGKVKPSHVLGAMGVSDELSSCALRISTGWQTTGDDIAAFIAAFKNMAESLRHSS